MRNYILTIIVILMFICSNKVLAQTNLELDVAQTLHNGSGLGEVYALVITDDGQYVYAAATRSDAVSIWRRDATTGMLDYVDSVRPTLQGLEILEDARHVEISPDQKHVYVSAQRHGFVAVFERDLDSGLLVLTQSVWNGTDGVSGLTSPTVALVSSDGSQVYVIGFGNIVVFDRDSDTGHLAFKQNIRRRDVMPDGVFNFTPSAIAASSDGKQVFVTISSEHALAVFDVAPSTGMLALNRLLFDERDGIDGIGFPASVTLSENDEQVYVTGLNELAVFTRNPVDGELSLTQTINSATPGVPPLRFTTGVTIGPNNQKVYITGRDGHELFVFDRSLSDGVLEFEAALSVPLGDIISTRSPVVSKDNQNIYIAGPASNSLGVFTRDLVTNNISFLQAIPDQLVADGLGSASAMALSPDGEHLYVIGRDIRSGIENVSLFRRDHYAGMLAHVRTYSEGADGIELLSGAVSLEISPDGASVYVNVGLNRAITVFSRNSETGELSFVQTVRDGLDVNGSIGANDLGISPDGLHLYAVGRPAFISHYNRDVNTGSLTYVETQSSAVAIPVKTTVAPDGRFVYIADRGNRSVHIFNRDSVSGVLGYNDSLSEPATGVFGLLDLRDFILTPDGRFMYTVAELSNALAVFTRNGDTGELSFLQQFTDGQDGVSGLHGAGAVTVSPDGGQVYVAADGFDSAVTSFTVDSQSGLLTLGQTVFDNDDSVPGLLRPSDILTSPDSEFIITSSIGDAALTVFQRMRPESGLTITKSSIDGFVDTTDTVQYTIVVENTGPADISSVNVIDNLPDTVDAASAIWTCVPDVMSLCTPSGTGDLQDFVNIAVGERVIYTLQADVTSSEGTAIVNTASLQVPASHVDTNAADNQSTAVVVVGLFADSFEN